MRRMTRIVTLAAALVVVAPPAAAFADGVGSAGASRGGGGTVVAFSQMLRRCDFSATHYNNPTGYGRPIGVVRSDGSTVTAEVQIATAIPGIHYDVRLIQVPQPSSANCWGGDPGVAMGALNTDGAGAAAVTLADTVEPGATGAWVFISRADAFSQSPAEFYTTDFVAPI